MQPFKLYKLFAIGEALTWSLLITGLLIRALFGVPPVVLTIVGGIHGAVFLGYGVSATLVGVNQRWSFGRIVAAISLAIVPYATVPFEKSVEKKGMLVGDWRTEKSADPRDNNWFDSLFRWFIKRPALLVIVLLAVVVGIFSGLLFLGPPDTWGSR